MNNTKSAIIGLAVVLILGVGGYFGYQSITKDTAEPITETYSENQANNSTPENTQVTEPTPTEPAATTAAPAQAVVSFQTSEGNFKVTLDGKAAPLTVNNFVKLANEGFYDGLKFHRIVEGFMIQGGDPQGDGTGGPGYTVPAEIGLKHTKGAIAMARTGDQVNPKKESSGSQFYITLDAQTFLDGQYTVFGYVTEGLSVVEKIGMTPTEPNPMSGEQSIPLKDVVITKVTVDKAE